MLTDKAVCELFPEATNLIPVPSQPGVVRVMNDRQPVGIGFYTDDVLPIPAYSGKPVRTFVALDMAGTIVGLKIVSHEEPILVVGVRPTDLEKFVDQYVGKQVSDKLKLGRQVREGYTNIDGLSGATITSIVINKSVTVAAKKVYSLVTDQALSPEPEEPLWFQSWKEGLWKIIVLLTGLGVLLFVMFFQDWFVVHPAVFASLRTGYLIFTVLFIGIVCGAQLSVFNIFAFSRVLKEGFEWDSFLIDPVVYILWAFVALSILLWGRGVFCGWLCPFGAVQELVHKISRSLNLKQYAFPELVHERLWAIKYFVLLSLVGLSLDSIERVIPFIEVEPFKTVFSLNFNRSAAFVVYAIILIVVSAFNTKFYCKYVCPLGAALSIATRFRIFDWLRRYNECGSPCQVCSVDCSVGAIRSTGEIIETECHYCLECQSTYWDEARCPVMVKKRDRRERHARREQLIPQQPRDITD
ncbi:MAG: 4Fe-4S binding protein [Pseudomonadales bacterium]|nr:4Fe-4S binding protein [Pseudomonadales bacterium]